MKPKHQKPAKYARCGRIDHYKTGRKIEDYYDARSGVDSTPLVGESLKYLDELMKKNGVKNGVEMESL